MAKQDQDPRAPCEDREEFTWLVEQRKLQATIKTSHRISQELAAQKEEFNRLAEEVQTARNETRALRLLLDQTALQFGLQPLPPQRH